MADEERRRELGRFLRDRRAKLQPHQVGLPAGPRRRVSGLRREEVAALAGVGVTWYTMLEAGTANGPSSATLDAVARALHLSGDEVAYLHLLAQSGIPVPPMDSPEPLAAAALTAIEWAPAYIATSQWNVLAWNRAMSLVWNIEPPGGPPFNIVRRMFRDAKVRSLHGDGFGAFAHALVAMYRHGNARRFADPVYHALYDELRDDETFARAWDAYRLAAPQGSIRARIESPNVGAFTYEALTLSVSERAGQSIVVQIPDAASGQRLRARLSETS